MAADSVAKLSTDVTNTVETLQELGQKLKENEFSFAQSFCTSAETIISVLHELNRVRVHAHQLLEGETITASALRHKLNTHVSKLQAEAAAAVISARQSNQTRLQELKNQLSSMSEEASHLVKKHEVLGLHNDMLLPELTTLQNEHSNRVKILNEKMLEKAGLQIVLNETLEQLGDTSSQIDNVERDIAALQDELSKKRESFEKEKCGLMEQLDETKLRLDAQNQESNQLYNELHYQEYEAAKAETDLNATNSSINDVEGKIEIQLEMEMKLTELIEQQEKEKESLIAEGERIEDEITKMAEEFAIKMHQGEETINQLLTEVSLSLEEKKRLSEQSRAVKAKWNEAKDELETQTYSLATIRESVNTAKESLMKESESGVKYEMERKELEFRLDQLDETHKVNVQLFKEEIADLRDKLTRERKNRLTEEEKYKDLQAVIQQHKSDHMETMDTLNTQLRDSRQSEDELSLHGEELKKNLSDCEANIEHLSRQVIELEQRLAERKSTLEKQLTDLEDNIAELTDDINDYTEQLQELEPHRDSLEASYSTLFKEYEDAKKAMIELKNKKASLNDTCLRLQRELEKMSIPQAQLRMDTLKCRAYTRKNLRTQKEFVEDLESKVKQRQIKLKSILLHNDRLSEAICRLEQECARFISYDEKSSEREGDLVSKLEEMKRELERQWRENREMGQVYHDRDSATMNSLSALQKESAEQMKELSVTSIQFDREMKCFNEFLAKLVTGTAKDKLK